MGPDLSADALSMYQPLKEARRHAISAAGTNAWYVSLLSLFELLLAPTCFAAELEELVVAQWTYGSSRCYPLAACFCEAAVKR